MASPVIQFKRGAFANLPALQAGEPALTTDTFEFYVGLNSTSAGNKFFGSHRYWTRESTSTGSGVNLVEGTSNGSQYVTLKSPDALSGIVTFTMPGTDGSNGHILTTDGSGTLSFSAPAASSFTLAADSGSNDTFNTGETLTFTGGEGIDTSVSDNTITIAAEDATTSNKGIASFDTNDFGVSSGAVSLGDDVVKDITTDSGALTPSSHGFSILGGEGMNVTHSGTTITVAGEDATDSNKGVASFNATDFSVSSGAVTLQTERIEDIVGAAITTGTQTRITVSYDDTNGEYDFVVDNDLSNYDNSSSAFITASSSDTLTNKTFDANGTGNSLSNVEVADLAASAVVIESEGIGSNDNDTTLPTSAAVKDYVDTQVAAVDVEFGTAGDSGTGTVNTSQSLTVSGTSNEIETSASGQTITIGLPNDVTVSNNLTVSGNLYVNGSTTQVNTSTTTIEDQLLDLGMVDGSVPSSDLNKDIGVLFNYYSGSAKKAAVYWDDSTSRIVVSQDVSESSGVLTNNTSAALEVASLYVNGCEASAVEVIGCDSGTITLSNVTIDGGTF